MNTPNDNIEQKAREWYAKEYPLTSATSNRQLCEEDVVMCAAFARSLAQPSAPTVDQIMEAIRPHIEMRGGPIAYSDRCYDLRARLTKLLTNP